MSQEINIMAEAKIPTAKLPLGLQAQIQADQTRNPDYP